MRKDDLPQINVLKRMFSVTKHILFKYDHIYKGQTNRFYSNTVQSGFYTPFKQNQLGHFGPRQFWLNGVIHPSVSAVEYSPLTIVLFIFWKTSETLCCTSLLSMVLQEPSTQFGGTEDISILESNKQWDLVIKEQSNHHFSSR